MVEASDIRVFEHVSARDDLAGRLEAGSKIIASVLKEAKVEAASGWSKRAPGSTHTKQYRAHSKYSKS